MVEIKVLEATGKISTRAIFGGFDAKKALVCSIMQLEYDNYNTWEYPSSIKGMRKSAVKPGAWSFDTGDRAYMAIPQVA